MDKFRKFMKITTEMANPPKAPLAFRVGVVGHRPGRLASADLPALKNLVRKLLTEVRESVYKAGKDNSHLYSGHSPVLRVISPLSEGADRIFAGQAIELNYQLTCPMPFKQEEYENDFSPATCQEADSLEKFRELLRKAEKNTRLVRFEMAGNRSTEGEAFRNNGQIVLNQSDLLFVVWDGIYQDKHGGTEETLSSALTQNIPVVWIDANAPHPWQIISPGNKLKELPAGMRHIPSDQNTMPEIGKLVNDILAIPSASGLHLFKNGQAGKLDEYYRERQPKWNTALLWKFFRNMAGSKGFKYLSPIIVPLETSVEPGFSGDSFTMTGLDEQLSPYYKWPDMLADNYADKYRSGFIFTYFFAALAVGAALFPLLSGWMTAQYHKGLTICIIIESLIILTIIGFVFLSRKRRWHGRWLDYRMTAESIRQLTLFMPLGGGKPFPKMAAHLTQYGNPSATWMTWYVQSVERMAGLPALRVNKQHLKECLSRYALLLAEQKNYHQQNAIIYTKIDRRLHHIGELTLWLTLMSCLVHLLPTVVAGIILSPVVENALTFACGFLPALGASMAGINHQGEFKRMSMSSASMYEQFSRLENEINHLITQLQADKSLKKGYFFRQVSEVARTIANLMINEVSDWKVIYQDRPPTLPA